jgi:hypothetical protein
MDVFKMLLDIFMKNICNQADFLSNLFTLKVVWEECSTQANQLN